MTIEERSAQAIKRLIASINRSHAQHLRAIRKTFAKVREQNK